MSPDRRACFHKLCILFFLSYSKTQAPPRVPTRLCSVSFGHSNVMSLRKQVRVWILNPGHSEISWILVSTLKLGCELNIINPLPNLALVTALKGDDRSVSCWLRSNLGEGDFLPAVNTAAARIPIKTSLYR